MTQKHIMNKAPLLLIAGAILWITGCATHQAKTPSLKPAEPMVQVIPPQGAHPPRVAEVPAQAEPIYAEAIEAYFKKDLVNAQTKFQEVARIIPDYKKTRDYLSRIDQDVREQKRQAEQARVEKAGALYRESQALLTGGDLTGAFSKFSALEMVYPDYKNTRTLLADVKSRLVAKGIPVPVIVAPVVQVPVPALTKLGAAPLSDEKGLCWGQRRI